MPLGIPHSKEVVKVLAEVTLVLVLFSDASLPGVSNVWLALGLHSLNPLRRRRPAVAHPFG
jgi:hypothetical protein